MKRSTFERAEIRDRRIRTQLLAALTERPGAALHALDSDAQVRAALTAAPPTTQLRLLGAGDALEGDRRFRFGVDGAQFELAALCTPDDSGALASDLRLYSRSVRRVPRVPLARDEAAILWRARGRSGQGHVVDASNRGLQVVFSPQAAPPAELSLFTALLELPDGALPGAVQVRRREVEEGLVRLGLEFTPDDGDLETAPRLLALQYPELVERWAAPPEAVRALMRASGYVELRDGPAMDAAWLGLRAPNLTQDRLYQGQDGALVGHLSQTRAYRTTWVGHQLATQARHPESLACWLSLYRFGAALPLLVDGDDARQIAYFDPTKPWHRRFFDAFVRWVDDPRAATILRLDRFEVPHATALAAEADPRPEAGPRLAAEDELAAVAALVRDRLPPLIADALDIRSDRLRTSALHPDFAAAGLERSREVLVLPGDKGLDAAVLLERGSPSLSIFGLFDMAQVYVAPGVRLSAETQLGLLQSILRWYRDRGVRRPMVTAREGVLAPDASAGMERVETMGLMAWSADGLRHYENYLGFTFGRRPQKGRAA